MTTLPIGLYSVFDGIVRGKLPAHPQGDEEVLLGGADQTPSATILHAFDQRRKAIDSAYCPYCAWRTTQASALRSRLATSVVAQPNQFVPTEPRER
jgi:hypothetical protein